MDPDDIKATGQSAAENAQSSLRATRDKLADATSRTADRLQGVAGQVGAKTNDMYGRAADQVQSLADRLPGSASDAYEASRRGYAQTSDAVGRHVAKQPIEALLLAGAIGYLVGWATSRN